MRRFFGALVLAVSATSGQAIAQSAETALGDRAFALSLDTRCSLFSPAQRAALEAARLQARGALLRSGIAAATLDRFADQRAREADALDCASDEVGALTETVDAAFAAYQRVASMNFPGETYDWDANRQLIPDTASWVLLQDTGTVRIGLASIDGEIAFTVASTETVVFSSAQLILRDTAREPELYDPTIGGFYDGPNEAPWARWTPPEHARAVIWASRKLRGAVVNDLTGAAAGTAFRFPDAAAIELALRDPRETARIDYLDLQGQRAATVYVEIGDFAAALAFLRAVAMTTLGG